MVTNVHRTSCKSPLICQIVMKLEFSQYSFEKYSIIKFHKNPPSGIEFVPCGLKDRGGTDRQNDDANSHFLQLCERVKIPLKIIKSYFPFCTNGIHKRMPVIFHVK